MADTDKAKLATTIAKVMGGIGDIPKNGHNDRFNYDYPLDEDVMKALREQMIEHGLVALPSVEGRSIEERTTSGGTEMLHTRVQLRVTLIDTDSGQQKAVQWEGEAQDSQDKGLYKAYTSGMKYWALKTFLMSAGDDVERADAAAEGSSQSSQDPQEPTDSQVEYATDLAHKEVWSDEERKGIMQRIDNYNRSEMSDLIDSLKESVEERQSNGQKKEPAEGFEEDQELPF